MYKLSDRSIAKLEHVHIDLVRVVKAAIIICEVDFGISEGMRTIEQQEHYYRTGKSQTMNSLHLKQQDGFSHAVDLFPIIEGKADYTKCDLIAKAMKQCAKELKVIIEWGGDWKTLIDKPHFQLKRK